MTTRPSEHEATDLVQDDPSDLTFNALAHLRREGYRVLAPFIGGPRRYRDGHFDDTLSRGLMVDTETTGPDASADQAIQLAMVPFCYHPATGEVVEVGPAGIFYEEPTRPISAESHAVHGITADRVKGQHFALSDIAMAFGPSQLVLAHNAAFDATILYRRFGSLVTSSPWGCTYTDVAWKKRGYTGASLGALLQDHTQHHFTGHDAADDCYAALHVLATPFADGTYPLQQILQRIKDPRVTLFAVGAPFEVKDALAKRGYKWNDPGKGGALHPTGPKAWCIDLDASAVDSERAWLNDAVYRWQSGQPVIRPIDPTRRFLRVAPMQGFL